MKILQITKYPPIEGGVSTQAYWRAKALGKLGYDIFVVTNADEVETEYREQISNIELPNLQPKGVRVISSDPSIEKNPMHIPTSKAYTEKLANLAIQVINENEIDIIETSYLLPYGIAGLIAKALTGKPLIVRHAGSDISRLMTSPSYRELLTSLLDYADSIITDIDTKNDLIKLGLKEANMVVCSKAVVDTEEFNPDVEPLDLNLYGCRTKPGQTIITYIGKIPYQWETKGIGELIEAASGIEEDFNLLFCANGSGKSRFLSFVENKRMAEKVEFIEFLPPWLIPRLIKASSCVVVPERDFQVPGHVSHIPLETAAVGRCMIISTEVHKEEPYSRLIDDKSAFSIDPRNIRQFRNSLITIIKRDSMEKVSGFSHSNIDIFKAWKQDSSKIQGLYDELLLH